MANEMCWGQWAIETLLLTLTEVGVEVPRTPSSPAGYLSPFSSPIHSLYTGFSLEPEQGYFWFHSTLLFPPQMNVKLFFSILLLRIFLERKYYSKPRNFISKFVQM